MASPRFLAAWAVLVALFAVSSAQQNSTAGFIRIEGGRFVDDNCQEFLFSGWNGWKLLEYALNDPSYITNKFQLAQGAKLNLLRFFVAGDDGGPVLAPSPGQLDETVARGLDFIIAEAAKFQIRLTPVLMNLWKFNNGVSQFEQWCGTGSNTINDIERVQAPKDWFLSPTCRQQVKDHYSSILNRRNTLTGILYKDDPTIFSWNLMNEARCKGCGPEPIDSWVGKIAAHVKSVDPNHLVTTGFEGFFDSADNMASFNPNHDGTNWASKSGQDFRANHAHSSIDYAVIHLWPDNWKVVDTGFGQRWMDSHTQVASQLGVPLVLEEFGKNAGEWEITSVRNPWFVLVNGAVDASLQSGGALRGALFWQWDGETGPRPTDGSNIRPSDSTFQEHITPFAHRLAEAPPSRVSSCTPRAAAFSGAAGRKLLSHA